MSLIIDDDMKTRELASDANVSPPTIDPSRRYATLTFLRGSVVALTIALSTGVLGVLYYIPVVGEWMTKQGIQFTVLRPLHTTFAAVFIFLGGVAVVHRYFEDIAGPMGAGERLRIRLQVILWAIAGLGVFGSLLGGVFSGREYMGFHPIWSIPILLGWMLFAWNFVLHLKSNFLRCPVHISMWTVGVFFFMFTFTEQHYWLLETVYNDPIFDMRIQWKATGTLVGSFNLFVYGSLYYLGCKLSGDESYAHSNLAYALFAVGLLNSFTNFGHHTYHLPQNDAVKWISFVISMTEIILLARVVWDISAMVKKRGPACAGAIELFITAAKWWTCFMLASSIVISIPPLNALIHGTPVIMGHGMGAEIGIDGMVLFATFCWLIKEMLIQRKTDSTIFETPRLRRLVIGLNIGVALLVGWLTFAGTIIGVWRYDDLAPPLWLSNSNPYLMVFFGAIAAWYLANLLVTWLRLLFPGRRLQQDPGDHPAET
ncbi:MAG: cbb3-type cytochrome c oxidase subunit I [Planctomycetota bacterium]|nr:cbb3-type cytochrome c oxidase subunit I [Planctomycetota bacterium]